MCCIKCETKLIIIRNILLNLVRTHSTARHNITFNFNHFLSFFKHVISCLRIFRLFFNSYINEIFYITDTDGKELEFPINYKDEELSQTIDEALKKADMNNDGFIDYAEYKKITE